MSESWHCVSGDFGDAIDYVEMIIEANVSGHYKLFYDVRCISWLEIDGEEVELPDITENRSANYFAALSTGRHVVHFKPKEGNMSDGTPWKERQALLGWCSGNQVTEVTLPEGWTVVNSKMFEGEHDNGGALRGFHQMHCIGRNRAATLRDKNPPKHGGQLSRIETHRAGRQGYIGIWHAGEILRHVGMCRVQGWRHSCFHGHRQHVYKPSISCKLHRQGQPAHIRVFAAVYIFGQRGQFGR